MKTSHALYYALIILSLSACEEEEVVHPKIETGAITVTSASSFTASATIATTGSIPVVDHGFLYGPYDYLDVNYAHTTKTSLGKNVATGFFEQKITMSATGDQSNYSQTLYIRAYLTNEKGTVYGAVKSFTLPTLTISSVAPMQARVGEVITIHGSNFAPDAASNVVKFNGTAATVKTASSTQLTVEVPGGITFPYYWDNSITITVIVGTQQAHQQNFKIAPTFNSFSPTSGTFGDVVTITGSNFTGHSYVIQLGELSVSAGSVSANAITFSIPSNVTAETFPISVQVDYTLTVGLPGQFTMTAPVITSLTPPTGISGTLVTLTGSGFIFPDYYLSFNKVKFGDVTASLYQVTSTQIKAFVPTGLTVGASYEVTLSTGVHTVAAPQHFTVVSPAITDFTPKTASHNSFVTITGTNFGTLSDEVLFGSVYCSIYSWSETSIQVRVPQSYNLAAGAYKITVNAGGQSAISEESITIQ